MDATQQPHVVICGGGPVGLSLALGLAQRQVKVTLLEAVEPTPQAQNSFDGRVLALSQGSKHFFEALGVWSYLQPSVTAIEHVHVSQRGYLGLTLMHAEDMQVEALGYSIRAQHLGEVLWQQVQQHSNIQVNTPACLQSFVDSEQGVEVVYQQDGHTQTVMCDGVVGADGTQSQVRKTLALPLIEKDYKAWAILAQVNTEQPHQGWAFERFTSQGPVALLPLATHSHKLVYVASEQDYPSLLELSDQDFIQAFTRQMGERFGRYEQLSERVAYPLKETYVERVVVGRAILMGNASHTQHPVAAQGLNLGLRDVSDFLQIWHDQLMQDPYRLLEYEKRRQADHRKVMGLTDGLIRIFEHPSPLVGHARGLAMMALQMMPSLKRRLARFSMQGAK